MAWVVTPPTQTAQQPPGWTTTPVSPTPPPLQGWLGTGQITVTALPSGGGTLSVAWMIRPFINALLAGNGALSVTVVKKEFRTVSLAGSGTPSVIYKQIHPATAQFFSGGVLTSGVVPTLMYPQFGGDGVLAGLTDGLSAIVSPGMSIDVSLAGLGTLVSLIRLYQLRVLPGVGGAGTISVTTKQVYPAAPAYSGVGALSAVAKPAATRTVSLAGGGTLSATAIGNIPRSAQTSGTGTLSATAQASYSRTTALGGDGTLSATVMKVAPTAASLAGIGTLSATVFPRYTRGFVDTFNRADNAVSPGNDWVNRVAAGCGISGNALYPTVAGSTWCISTAPVPMASNDMEVSVIFGGYSGGYDATMIFLGCNDTGEGAFLHTTGTALYLFTQTTWYNWTNQYGIGVGQMYAGDRITARRVGNTYYGYVNDVLALTWPDSTNIVPRDVNHRLVGAGLYNDNNGYRSFDNFEAHDFPGTALSGKGTLSATATRYFPSGPFNEENTPRTNQPVPVGTFGCWVTLRGAGAGGGAGSGGSFSARGGGAGGGGGAKINRQFVSRDLMGSTYTVTLGVGGASQTNGGSTSFASGSVNATAGGGTKGTNGSTSGQAAAGVGGGRSASGGMVTTGNDGANGGLGGNASGSAGGAGTSGPTGGAGGGGGGGRNSIGTSYAGGTGGAGVGVVGGAGAGAGGSQGTAGGNASPLPANGGGGGGGGAGSNGNTVTGGNGGNYSAGGGGGGGGNTVFQGGVGGEGYTLIEWT